MPPIDEKQILDELESLAEIEPSAEATALALSRTRSALNAATTRRQHLFWRIVMPTSLAASIALLASILFLISQQPAGAAEALERVLQANEAYKGWIHESRSLRPDEQVEAHYHTGTGTLAWRTNRGDWFAATFISLDEEKQVSYESKDATIRIRSISPEYYHEQLESQSRAVLASQFISHARTLLQEGDVTVQQEREGDLDRYELVASNGQATAEITLWVDPNTKLLSKVRRGSGEKAPIVTFTYNQRVIAGIYDLGVDRAIEVVDERPEQKPADRIVLATKPAGPATLTRDQLLSGVSGARAKIQNLTVKYWYFTKQRTGNAVSHESQIVVVKGDSLYIDTRRSSPATPAPYNWHSVTAFNGKRSTVYQGNNRMASVKDGRPDEVNTIGLGFFDMNMLNPPVSLGVGPNRQDLATLLTQRSTKVRKDLEEINGYVCHVVEGPGIVVWLDASRGFVPIRQRFFWSHNPDSVMMEFMAESVSEIDPGIWFVTSGRKFVPAKPGIIELSTEIGWMLQVETTHEGKPAIAINRNISDDFFDLWKHLPIGTTLADMSTTDQAWWLVGIPEGPQITEKNEE